MFRYKLTLAYDGTHYAGWQVQATGQAIQPLVQKSLTTILRHPTDLTGAGRTDAGVHALGQTAHFDTPISCDLHRLRFALNALLPKEIQILDIQPVPSDFHARYSAQSKIYHYHLQLDPVADPFTRFYRYHVLGACDLVRMQQAIPHLLGTHDFTSFANKAFRGSASRDPIRTLARIDLIQETGGVHFEFEADGFLYKMIRNLVGTLLDIGAKTIAPDEIPLILAAKDRRSAGICAPPHGLCLVQVRYGKSSINQENAKSPPSLPQDRGWGELTQGAQPFDAALATHESYLQSR